MCIRLYTRKSHGNLDRWSLLLGTRLLAAPSIHPPSMHPPAASDDETCWRRRAGAICLGTLTNGRVRQAGSGPASEQLALSVLSFSPPEGTAMSKWGARVSKSQPLPLKPPGGRATLHRWGPQVQWRPRWLAGCSALLHQGLELASKTHSSRGPGAPQRCTRCRPPVLYW